MSLLAMAAAAYFIIFSYYKNYFCGGLPRERKAPPQYERAVGALFWLAAARLLIYSYAYMLYTVWV